MLQDYMRGFVYVVGFALGSFGLAACGSVTSRDLDAGPGGAGDGPIDGHTGDGMDGGDDAPVTLCVAPSNPPTAKVFINIFADADGHSGPYSTCPKVGTSFTTNNPQYVFCRRWGGEVSGSQGFNHWWLWTELDAPLRAPAWISAYYLQGQGNDQANGIPDCP